MIVSANIKYLKIEASKSCRTYILYMAHYDGKSSKMDCAYDKKTVKDCKENNFRLYALDPRK